MKTLHYSILIAALLSLATPPALTMKRSADDSTDQPDAKRFKDNASKSNNPNNLADRDTNQLRIIYDNATADAAIALSFLDGDYILQSILQELLPEPERIQDPTIPVPQEPEPTLQPIAPYAYLPQANHALDSNVNNSGRLVQAVHEKIKSHACTYDGCQSAFTTKSNLNHHIQIVHEKVEAYTCPGCKSSFTRKRDRTEHINDAHEGKPYTCTYPDCKSAFTRRGHLKEHTKGVHEQVMSHPCTEPECEKSFTRAHDLKRHIQAVHEKARSHPCTYDGCPYATTRKCNLKKHIKSVHEKVKSHKCPHDGCTYSATEKGNLTKHMKICKYKTDTQNQG